MADSYEFIQVATQRVQFLGEQRQLLQHQEQEFTTDIERLEVLHERSRREMVSYLLGEASDAELAQLQERLQYPMLLNIKRGFEVQLADVQARLAEAGADPRIGHHDFHLSQVNDEIAEIEDAYKAVDTRMQMWTASTWFTELNERGYFDPNYEPSLLNRFWDWRAVSFLMEELEETYALLLPTPSQVRATWMEVKTEAEPIVELWNGLHQRRSAQVQLMQRYLDLKARPEQLFREMYDALSEALINHLEACPEALAIELAGQDKHLATFLKKNTGLTKQVEYLKQLRISRIQPLVQSLDAELSKLHRKLNKARRKNKYYSEQTLASMRDFKSDKWSKRHRKLTKIRTRISGFKGYKQGSFTDDFLWWDMITRGAQGDDVYEVRTFRRNNPNWNWRNYEPAWERQRQRRALDRAAQDLADRMEVQQDDDWGFDGS